MNGPTSLDLTLFQRILRTVAFATAINQLCPEHSYKARGGIYNVAVLVWLMIYQRLNGKGTLSSAVQFRARQAMSWQTRARAVSAVIDAWKTPSSNDRKGVWVRRISPSSSVFNP